MKKKKDKCITTLKYLLNTKIQENSGVIFNLSICNGTPIAIDTSKPKTSGEAG